MQYIQAALLRCHAFSSALVETGSSAFYETSALDLLLQTCTPLPHSQIEMADVKKKQLVYNM